MLKASITVLALSVALASLPAMAASSAVSRYEEMCPDVLEFLPRIVRKEAVSAVGPNAHVSLHTVYRGVQMTTFGNAGGLGRTIARNPTLAAALKRAGWRADDVVGIQITGDRVDLYVHRDP